MKYTIKYNGEYITELLGGWNDYDIDGEEYFQAHWIETLPDDNYAMEFETLEEAESEADRIYMLVDYLTHPSDLEIEEVVV